MMKNLYRYLIGKNLLRKLKNIEYNFPTMISDFIGNNINFKMNSMNEDEIWVAD
jgi:hypothetical protein